MAVIAGQSFGFTLASVFIPPLSFCQMTSVLIRNIRISHVLICGLTVAVCYLMLSRYEIQMGKMAQLLQNSITGEKEPQNAEHTINEKNRERTQGYNAKNRRKETGDEDKKGTASQELSDYKFKDIHPDVKIVPSTPEPGVRLNTTNCIPLPESPKPGVQICVHPKTKDRGVSETLLNHKLWERHLILDMDDILKKDSNMMLFDVGCNVGEYTLWAAAMGRDVVAVEMLPVNIRLVQTALKLSNLGQRVTMVNNAVYKEHTDMAIRFYKISVGVSRINATKTFSRLERDNNQTLSVKAVCIDDLIPLMKGRDVFMKMDIEDSEHTALMGAHKFFEEVNVKMVQMEWNRRVPEEIVPILDFMKRHKYAASRKHHPYSPINLATHKGNIDVYFFKKSVYNIK